VRILSRLQGEHRTTLKVGLAMLATNLCLMAGFALSIGGFLLLSLVGLSFPPGIVVLLFGLLSLYLWFYLGMSFPSSFSAAAVVKSSLIGLSPITLVTGAEYAFLLVDPEGCVGTHLMLLGLGTVSLVFMPLLVIIGLVVKHRQLRDS
jgi:hypothetical protein